MSKIGASKQREAAREATEPPETEPEPVELELAVSLRSTASGEWVASTLTISGDRVVLRDESKPNFAAYGRQQFKIRAGKLFAALDKGEKR